MVSAMGTYHTQPDADDPYWQLGTPSPKKAHQLKYMKTGRKWRPCSNLPISWMGKRSCRRVYHFFRGGHFCFSFVGVAAKNTHCGSNLAVPISHFQQREESSLPNDIILFNCFLFLLMWILTSENLVSTDTRSTNMNACANRFPRIVTNHPLQVPQHQRLGRGKSHQDLLLFDDSSICAEVDLLTPSDSAPKSLTVADEFSFQFLQGVIETSVNLLPMAYKEEFKAFGAKASHPKSPLTVSTLCSGTDGAIDVMKAASFRKQWFTFFRGMSGRERCNAKLFRLTDYCDGDCNCNFEAVWGYV